MINPHKRIQVLEQHRSKRNRRLGHVIAIIKPCNHREYLGLALMSGTEPVKYPDTVNIIRIETYDRNDKFTCRECPYDTEFFDNFQAEITEVMDIVDAALQDD